MSEIPRAPASPGDAPNASAAVLKTAAPATGTGDTGSLFGRARSVDLPAYSGPLDLLLKLIRKNEVDIYDIPIATITEQYLVELETMEHGDLAVAGDFLVMAATLLEIKSALMLPRPQLEADPDNGADPRAELVEHLLEYQAFQALADQFGQLERQHRLLYPRPFQPSCLEEYGPLRPVVSNLKIESLQRSFQALLERLDAREEPVTSLQRERLPLRLRLAGVQAELGAAGTSGLLLEELVRPQEGRLYVIVTFLAILELLRSGRVRIQEATGGGSYRFWLIRATNNNHVGPEARTDRMPAGYPNERA